VFLPHDAMTSAIRHCYYSVRLSQPRPIIKPFPVSHLIVMSFVWISNSGQEYGQLKAQGWTTHDALLLSYTRLEVKK